MKPIILPLIASSLYGLSGGLMWLKAAAIDYDKTFNVDQSGNEEVSSKKEFQANVEKWVNRHISKVNLGSTPCNKYLDPRKYGKETCFGISAGNKANVITKSLDFPKSSFLELHSPSTNVLSLLQLIEGNKNVANKLVKEEKVDFVGVVMESDPGCHPVYIPIKTVGNTMIGPGSITITNATEESVSNDWRVGGKLAITTTALSPTGSVEIGMSLDYIGSFERTTRKEVQREYRAPYGSTCTPSLLQITVYCYGTPMANVVYGSKGKVVSERKMAIKPTLLPNDKLRGEYFTPIAGCVDYAK